MSCLKNVCSRSVLCEKPTADISRSTARRTQFAVPFRLYLQVLWFRLTCDRFTANQPPEPERTFNRTPETGTCPRLISPLGVCMQENLRRVFWYAEWSCRFWVAIEP